MTKSISKLLQNLCGTQIVEENEQLPITASLPVLGLSNKAENQIEQGDQQDVDNEDNTPEAAEDVWLLLICHQLRSTYKDIRCSLNWRNCMVMVTRLVVVLHLQMVS